MAKGNKKSRREKDFDLMNGNFNKTADVLDKMASSTFEIMPLVAESLQFTKKLVLFYKAGYNAEFKNKTKKR